MGKRNRRRQLSFSLILLFGALSCQNNDTEPNQIKLEKRLGIAFYGNTQGTTYAILCNDSIEIKQLEIQNTLKAFDKALSTYIPESKISILNSAKTGVYRYQDSLDFFKNCITVSQQVYKLTKGAFDPTVYPLLQEWGFFKDKESIPDSITVKNLLPRIGFKEGLHFQFNFDSISSDILIHKRNANSKLVFNAIAQGQAVDVISELLESKGAKNYFIEIGGEISAKGLNSEGEIWRVGIDKPFDNSKVSNREIIEIIKLNNRSVATSGSYRKFYIKNNKKYSHTIDPKNGYPVQHQLLSTTVIANNCALADGLATAFMVMGTDRTIEFISNNINLDIELYLIFSNSKNRLETYMTNGFKTLILE